MISVRVLLYREVAPSPFPFTHALLSVQEVFSLTEDNLLMAGSHSYRQTPASSSLIIVYTVLMINAVTVMLDKNHIRLKLPRQYSTANYRIIYFCSIL